MAAYLIGQIIIHDIEKLIPYVANTSAAIAKYGGEVFDVVEAKEVMEGNWPVGARTTLVRFPDEASRTKLEEIGVYHVRDSKIAREQFFCDAG